MRVLAASPRSGWSAADRLGRDAFELLRIWRVFESIGISLRATDENIDDPFYFDIHAVIAANERRKFLERSAEGMNRAAKEGRYTGGIVPLGYTTSGDRGARRLVPDDSLMWERPLRRRHRQAHLSPPRRRTAGLVRISPTSSTRSASPPLIAAMVAASEAVAPRASGAPGISATSSSIPSTGASSSTAVGLPGRMVALSSLLRFPLWFPMTSGTPPSPPSSATAPCPATLAMPTSSALSSAAPSAASPSAVPGPGGLATAATVPWPIAARSLASASAPPSRARRPGGHRSGRMYPASLSIPDELVGRAPRGVQ